MPKRRKPEKPAVPEWVVTYGDMMSLLLCFFILLAAFSELKKPKEYQKVIDAIKHAFGVDGGDARILNDEDIESYPVIDALGMMVRIEQERSRSDNNERSTVGVDQTTSTMFRGRKWTVGKPLPFPPAGHELSDDHKEAIRELIVPQIRGSDKMFLVLGHAWGPDDRLDGMDPMELSYRRARAVRRFIVEECGVESHKLALWVAGDAQPVRLEPALSDEMTNRRVEVFMTDVPLSELHPDAAGTGRTP
jgi:chemotaxis protein MotB